MAVNWNYRGDNMELGAKLRQSRLDAGLSQRQLCEGIVTRNMLSLIESGRAKPSMDTLKQLSARLGKPVSWFLEEDALVSPNQKTMDAVRKRYDAGDWAGALEVMEGYRNNDPVYDREAMRMNTLLHLNLAEQVIGEGRYPYALELLNKADVELSCCTEELGRRKLLLLGRIPGQKVSALLPSLDEELLLRAEEALAEDPLRAQQLLDAAEDKQAPRWNLLRGKACLGRKAYREAASSFHKAEKAYPRETAPLLETCYRELEDYKRAYEYALRRQSIP